MDVGVGVGVMVGVGVEVAVLVAVGVRVGEGVWDGNGELVMGGTAGDVALLPDAQADSMRANAGIRMMILDIL